MNPGSGGALEVRLKNFNGLLSNRRDRSNPRNNMDGGERKLNCWEFMKCGKEHGRAREEELGTCPASTNSRTDGVNGGRNGGMICWAVAGTLCGGKHTGLYVPKIVNCMNCVFYRKVAEEEGASFVFTP